MEEESEWNKKRIEETRECDESEKDERGEGGRRKTYTWWMR